MVDGGNGDDKETPRGIHEYCSSRGAGSVMISKSA